MPPLRRMAATAAGLLVAVTIVLGAAASPSGAAANLVTNPGFETGDLSGWSCDAGTGAVVSTPVHSGSHALAGTPGSADAQCAQTVSVQPNSAYSLTGWVQGSYVYLGVTGTGTTSSSVSLSWSPVATATSVTTASGGGGNGSGDWRSPVYFMPLDNTPQNIADAMTASGEKNFLLAFVLDSGGCTPAWDGNSTQTVATDTQVASIISAIRAGGGDASVSFGGYNGTELGQSCGSAAALATAYQSVISKYRLSHIDLDVENAALGDTADETKRFQAVKTLEQNNPGLVVQLTIPMTSVGLPDTGKAEIQAAISAGARLDVVNIMDFDYGLTSGTQVTADETVAEDVHAQLKTLYGWDDATAYGHTSMQLMNGHTDQPSELFTQDTFTALLGYAQQHHLAQFGYWDLNRDRACDPSVPHNWADGACSSVTQQPYDFTKIVAQYHG